MQTAYHVQAGIYVEAHTVLEDTAADLAQRFRGKVRRPASPGKPELVFPSDDGDLVVPVGGVLLARDGDFYDGYSDPLEFQLDYATVR